MKKIILFNLFILFTNLLYGSDSDYIRKYFQVVKIDTFSSSIYVIRIKDLKNGKEIKIFSKSKILNKSINNCFIQEGKTYPFCIKEIFYFEIKEGVKIFTNSRVDFKYEGKMFLRQGESMFISMNIDGLLYLFTDDNCNLFN